MATRPAVSAPFGDYIVYVDESGDHALDRMDTQYPVFVLTFCLFKKTDYTEKICPAVQTLKFKHFGHDAIVLHEREIRKAVPPFATLQVPSVRTVFMEDVNHLIESAPMTVVAVVIRKDRLTDTYSNPDKPYFLDLEFGLERICRELDKYGQQGKRTHIVLSAAAKRRTTT